MSFLNNLVNEFTHQGSHGNEGQQQQQYGQQQYGQQQSYGQQGPPQVPPPWIAEWDNREGRWIFINRQTGERTYNQPHQGYGGGGGGYPPQPQGYQQGYYGGAPPPQQYQQQPTPQQQKSHSGRNMALGVGAGVLGGALLMHEGEKVEEHWKRDEYLAEDDAHRAEGWVDNKVYDGVQDVENFPDDAARWTGRKVQEVEDIPQDIDNKWDNAVQDVEDVPDDVAGWAGRKVGDVERFDDNIQNSYDDGRDDARYDDDNNNNDGGW